MDRPKRKESRLKNYDYSQNGAYFVTICTQNRIPYFVSNVGADRCVRPKTGAEIAEYWLYEIPHHFEYVSIDKSVIMPDHIHFILRIDRPICPGGHAGPPLPQIVQWYKTVSTAEYSKLVKSGLLPPYDKKLWQQGYYDHVIRNDTDYLECMRYIDENPLKAQLKTKKEL